jgi:Predicted Zn peptidase
MVTLAREARGLSQSELAARLHVTQSRLSKIEAGLLVVPETMLVDLTRELRYPSGFFRQAERRFGIGISEFYHRKRQKLGGRALDAIHARLDIMRMQIGRLLRSVELTSTFEFPHVDIDDFNSDPEEVARAVRATWKLPRGPIASVTKSIEDAGGIVVRCDFDTKLLDAVSRLLPGLPPLFFTNAAMPADRERYTLAHEIAHVVMHTSAHPEIETEANRFASEFLMPAQDIKSSLFDINLPKLAALKRVWRVSMASLLRRAFDLQTIPERRYRFLNMQLAKAGYKLREPVETSFPHENIELLQTIFEFHTADLAFSGAELASLLAMEESEVQSSYQRALSVRSNLRRIK